MKNNNIFGLHYHNNFIKKKHFSYECSNNFKNKANTYFNILSMLINMKSNSI